MSAPIKARLFASRVIAQQPDQAGGVPPPATSGLDTRIKLIDQRRNRQSRSVDARLRDADPKVLAHPVDREAEVELVGGHRLAAVVHLPGLSRALADDFQDSFDIQPRAHSKVDAF